MRDPVHKHLCIRSEWGPNQGWVAATRHLNCGSARERKCLENHLQQGGSAFEWKWRLKCNHLEKIISNNELSFEHSVPLLSSGPVWTFKRCFKDTGSVNFSTHYFLRADDRWVKSQEMLWLMIFISVQGHFSYHTILVPTVDLVSFITKKCCFRSVTGGHRNA